LSICQLHILLSRTAQISLELHFCVELHTKKMPCFTCTGETRIGRKSEKAQSGWWLYTTEGDKLNKSRKATAVKVKFCMQVKVRYLWSFTQLVAQKKNENRPENAEISKWFMAYTVHICITESDKCMRQVRKSSSTSGKVGLQC